LELNRRKLELSAYKFEYRSFPQKSKARQRYLQSSEMLPTITNPATVVAQPTEEPSIDFSSAEAPSAKQAR
jgi:hypothetical protein